MIACYTSVRHPQTVMQKCVECGTMFEKHANVTTKGRTTKGILACNRVTCGKKCARDHSMRLRKIKEKEK